MSAKTIPTSQSRAADGALGAVGPPSCWIFPSSPLRDVAGVLIGEDAEPQSLVRDPRPRCWRGRVRRLPGPVDLRTLMVTGKDGG